MANYVFVTTWQLTAPLEDVWDAIYHADSYPTWWNYVKQVTELAPGDDAGIGSRRRFVWATRLPYKLIFDMETTRVEAPFLLEGRASGELEGRGLWELSYADGGTSVRYTWQVRTTKRWMNLLAPVARPFFQWNHDAVMQSGGEGLARLLGARLARIEHGEPAPV